MNAILKHWTIIKDHKVLSKIFTKTPILAYSRTKNLKDLLVHAKFNYNEETDSQEDQMEDISPTLQVLQDLERESRGFNDSFFYENFIINT